MPEEVHILASCRKPELLPATLLVFQTLRVGFPTADIVVWVNKMPVAEKHAVREVARGAGASVLDTGGRVAHDAWIEWILDRAKKPFWVADTDIAFFQPCEGWKLSGAIAGRFAAEFVDPWSDTVHVERLHTALMRFNPGQILEQKLDWARKLPESWMAPKMEFVRQHYAPVRGSRTRFYDTTAGLWHTIGGTQFTAEQDACFEHLHCGTYSDQIGESLGIESFRQKQYLCCENPQRMRGLKQSQDAYFAAHSES